jgi:hypothetical protein
VTKVRVYTDGFHVWKAAMRVKNTAVTKATRTATRQGRTHLERAYKMALRRRSHKRGTPTPSPAGEPPAKISGHLARMVKGRGPRMVRRGVWMAEIGPTAVYSRIQELGGWTGRGHRTHLPPRPYIKPTTEAEKRAVFEYYRRGWEEALRA